MHSDDELDFKSNKFNPNKALEFAAVDVPDPSAQEYENLDDFRQAVHSHTLEMDKLFKKIDGVTGPGGVPVQRVKKDAKGETLRRFTEEQAPIKSTSNKKMRNILTRMEGISGPLTILRKCRELNLKVKVYTRNNTLVRSILTGYVVAFDKHWNMVLKEVEETFVKKIRNPQASLGDVSNYITVADLSIQEKDDVYVEPSPMMSAKKSYNPATRTEPDEQQLGQDTVFYARMMKRLGKEMPKPTKPLPEEPIIDKPVEDKKNEPAPAKDITNTESSVNPTESPGFNIFTYKIPKKTFKPREPVGLYEKEDTRSRGVRLATTKQSNTSEEDGKRLDLSFKASAELQDNTFKVPTKSTKPAKPCDQKPLDTHDVYKHRRKRKKFELRKRQANQLFIRGEQVVLIAVAESEKL